MTRIAKFVTVIFVATAGFTARAQQPFSNIQQSPTTSPYLNLLNRSNPGTPTYQTLVRPQVQQQQENQQQQQQIQHLARQQSNLAAGGGLNRPARGVSTEIRGTGHIAGFMIHGNYYPQPQLTTNDPITRRLVTLNYNQ